VKILRVDLEADKARSGMAVGSGTRSGLFISGGGPGWGMTLVLL
jgi:hypothetical protein